NDGIRPFVSRIVDPECYPTVIYVYDVGQTIPVNVAHQNPPRIITLRKPGTVLHQDALAPVTVAEVGPVFDESIMYKSDVLDAAACHFCPFNPGIGEIHIREVHERLALNGSALDPSFLGI